MKPIRHLLLLALTLPLSAAIDFEKDINPILIDNCIDCHGPDKEKAGLRLDQRGIMLKGGDSGLPTIVPGDPKASYLMEIISGQDPDMIMPPKGDPLSSEQISLIEKWIEEGAEWPGQMDQVAETTTDHWSFQPVVRPDVPESSESNPIDAFLDESLRKAGITPNEAADPNSLIRRASIILTGLPPTYDQVSSFSEEYAADPEKAYAELVDKLLDSPHFGERWAQHWLDVIRWSETNGSEANLYRKGAWTYRDYVIRAFNEDLPYDQFITEQLAGDQLGAGEATGFLVAGPHVPAATVGREPTAIRQARADRLDEIISTVGASMLGVTVSCARCHNHKFDPVSIQDYYSMSAIFQGVEFAGRYPELADDHPRKKRAMEIYPKMGQERRKLAESMDYWQENWGGHIDMTFPATNTRKLRIEFSKPNIFIDELEVFGPEDRNKNLASSSLGTTLTDAPEMADEGSKVEKANDGKYGTMVWKSRAPKGSKEMPWVEIDFPSTQLVERFRFSRNREYYFETDYLDMNKNEQFPDYRILALRQDGSWEEIADSRKSSKQLKSDPALKDASERLHEYMTILAEEGPRHSFIGKFEEQPGPTYVFHRGSPENPRDEVPPAGIEVIDGSLGLNSETPDPQRRMAFANWLTAPENPLTARVMVNRIWHHIFGTGIVATGSDFGLAGSPPSHPELLDWLAAEFVHPEQENISEWSTKSMIRLIVMSKAFRRSSLPNSIGLDKDAGSLLLWRYPPHRIEAEAIRDGILLASGKLDPSLGGRSFRIHNVKKTYSQWEVIDNYSEVTWRRMIYQERMRRVDDQIFTAFDFPDCGQVRDKRPVSTTPLQSLNLLNSPFVVSQSEYIAERAMKEADNRLEDAVLRAFELILNRKPDSEELAACTQTAKSNSLAIVCRSLINSNEFAFLP
ncbi:PSD1 and planctomycete cytochrome C domain-containing protein [Luteolibacter algae]|uniref:PSD1 and planctomycete cytochrome C domain-containing protein n=1 Tax=Luteolibacter algae TaxID=454151 RepID=A0ABW5D8S3_9BACT